MYLGSPRVVVPLVAQQKDASMLPMPVRQIAKDQKGTTTTSTKWVMKEAVDVPNWQGGIQRNTGIQIDGETM